MGLKMSRKLPLVVILGSTGTGKTKLSLELAKKFNGEIVGADSMQIYKELDIASAKATKEELASAPHHMVNILEPHEKFTVLEYRNQVLPIIDDMFSRSKLPIVVGGTNYYIESILWKLLVDEPGTKVKSEFGKLPNNEHELPSPVLHEKLKNLDPVMAKRLHPNNKRKIIRSLEVLYQKGITHSQIIEEQGGSSKSGGGLRYDNAIVFWLQCDKDVLDKRLDDRVAKMLEEGLLDELLRFHKLYNEERFKDKTVDADYSKGIFQSIGFKEFHSYLLLQDDEKNTEQGKKILNESLKMLKIATKRYARKQTKWTISRFLARKDRQVPPMYGLDTTNVSEWNENVTKPAFHIVDSFISRKKCDIEPIPMREDLYSIPNTLEETYICEVCKKILVGERQYEVHMKCRKHKMMLAKSKRELKAELVEESEDMANKVLSTRTQQRI
ncbi:tRNA dimethylallyltransferase [Anthonomus grandis grandis]|uniref:tRNA dimethylallyltransferase n=1 Tax=Anthonomus grandis grandis TaxID=2921223 RepID=UPI002165A3FA|nr:tRNA dimethylallyltransferase [Anthonomus grandis grandis]